MVDHIKLTDEAIKFVQERRAVNVPESAIVDLIKQTSERSTQRINDAVKTDSVTDEMVSRLRWAEIAAAYQRLEDPESTFGKFQIESAAMGRLPTGSLSFSGQSELHIARPRGNRAQVEVEHVASEGLLQDAPAKGKEGGRK